MASYPPRLVLGCGKYEKHAGWWHVDIDPNVKPNQVVDLEKDWPWDDNTFEEVYGRMILEHIFNTIHFMNELWRVCQDGAKIHLIVPDQSSPMAFADPTHKKVFNTESFKYFCSNGSHYWIHESYGITCNFILVDQNIIHERYPELNVWLRVKK